MNPLAFQTSSWYDALTLIERAAALHDQAMPYIDGNVNLELAERRRQRWRSQPPFTSSLYFKQRLASDGLNEKDFLYCLGESREAIQARLTNPQSWLTFLMQAFSSAASCDAIPMPEALRGREVAGFLEVIAPLLQHGLKRIQEGALAIAKRSLYVPFDPETVKTILLANLPEQLFIMLARTMVLELHVARLEGLLEGNTAQERFRSFVDRLRQPEIAVSILQEYPVLARLVVRRINYWVRFSLEFLEHLTADLDAIRKLFADGNDPGVLVAVTRGTDDSHRRGRSVMIARFSSGLRLVYKPRSVSVEKHFQELLQWLNEHGADPPFRTIKILDCSRHGWTEFISPATCTSIDEVRRFYERQGAYLALLHAIEATDFHFENIIAAGEHPVPIDLETLFHPRIGKGDEQHAEQLAGNKISYSVLRIGLLPQLAWQRRESEIVDLSGMGSLPGQMTPLPVPRWEHSGTDEMRLTRERIEMPAGSNRPTLHGAEVNLLDYSNAVMAGFVQLYRLLRRHRDNLLSDDGPLARFAEDETRIILRPTQTYGTLLGESFHPDVLRNALDRDRLFDRLWVGIEHSPHLLRVISSERRDLENGDIPIFTTRPNSCNVWNSVDERISGFIDEPGLVLAQRRIRELSNQNCSEQLSFIRAALSTLAPGRNEVRLPTYHAAEPKSIAEINSLLAAARKIGDRLEATALQTEDQASWIGTLPAKEGSWTLAPLGCDLYDGLPGVALFLAYLGAVTFDDRYRLLAQSAINALRHQMERMRSVSTALGAFDGWGGIIYALTHFAKLWNVPSLLAEVEGIVELLPALIERDEQLDIIGGAAGCIGSLSVLYRCAPSARTLAVAVQCGERLIDRTLAMERGVAWNGGSKQTKPLSGFSHGAAGIAWALLELAALTGEERFRTIALRGIEYERSLFSPDVGNWLDLRDGAVFDRVTGDHSNRFAVAWCHGAPGIGLGRLLSLRHLDDSKIRAEIDAALKTTVAQGFGRNHSLCHGDLGNLELLLQASQTLGDRRWSVHLERFASIILESIERDGWLCANPLGLQSPGLMTGLAGIGYELLRLAEPVRVPSILALAPPYIDRAEALRNGQHLSTVNSAFKSAA